jgi:hypothetical protein
LVLAAALAVVQVGLLVRDSAVVTLAAREGAREAAVTRDDDRVRRVVIDRSGLAEGSTDVEVRRGAAVGSPASVDVRYRAPPVVPFVAWLFPDAVQLEGTATMRQEIGHG